MEFWQLDVIGRVRPASGAEVNVATGSDDRSPSTVCAKVPAAATARGSPR